MRTVLRALYDAAARLASVASAVVPASNGKTAIAFHARRGIRERYARWSAAERDLSRQLVWMHAPSVGEGLQARPVLAMLRAHHPDVQLAYTFFSPSAEEFSRTLDVDFRDYLPFDSAAHMRSALDALRPDVLVFSKLDVWPQLVRQANARGVRIGLISATLAAASGRRGALARVLLRDAYALLDAVGAVDRADADRLVALGVPAGVLEVTGDTRFDQVWQRAHSVDRGSRVLATLASDRPTLVAGSTWPSDEAPLLDGFLAARAQVPELRLILAPHETTAIHLAPVERWAARHRLPLARMDAHEAAAADVVLVDRFGVLGELYALADVAFVGGGFHEAGLHSVLEPAAFGAPVLFGPRHHRSRDAALLLAASGARVVTSAAQIGTTLVEWFADAAARRQAGQRALDVVERERGAAERSLHLIERLLAK
ncbi:MAG: glycosyltransferase N-terminal domain-containing protein [Gemmatimonadaceae bacterium]